MSWLSSSYYRQLRRSRPGQRRAMFETLEQRTMLAGDISLVRYFDTWDADPQVVRSTDLAGITYHEPSGHLYLVDSEIDEIPEVFNGDNVFEVSLLGNRLHRTVTSNNAEPTGITYNALDRFFYVTNDVTKKLTRYDDRLNMPLATVDTRDAVAGADDPEDVASDPATGFLYVADGAQGGRQVLVYDSNLAFQYSFSVASRVQDPEGIAFHPALKHLFLVSAPDKNIFEYTLDGRYVEEYDYRGFSPKPTRASGLTFAPTSDPKDNPAALSLYMSDRGLDNYPDGRVFEMSITGARPAVVVQGTAAADVFEFLPDSASGQRILKVNGLEYPIPAGSSLIELDGAGGEDQVRFVGGDEVDTAQIRPNSALLRSGVYTVSAIRVESIRFDGAGGRDLARIYGSSRADTLTVGGEGTDPKQTTLTGDRLSVTATAETVYADGRRGKNTASFSGSAGSILRQSWKWLQTRYDPAPGVNGDEYFRILRGFNATSSDTSQVRSQDANGTQASLVDDPAEDATDAWPTQMTLDQSGVPVELFWLAQLEQADAQDRSTGKTDIQGNAIDEVFAYWE